MADNDKDLELHIGANIDDFLKELALMDKEYQEAVKDIEKKKAEIKLQTRVDISGARALGDKMAEIKARNRELNQLIQLQTEKTRLLKKAWQDVANSQNASKQQVEKALKAYQNSLVALNNLKEKANQGGISKNLSLIAPDTFRKIEQVKSVVASIGAEYPVLAKLAPAVAPVAGAFVAAGAAATGLYHIVQDISNESVEAAKKAAGIGEAIYKMKERLSMDETTANKLADIFTLDGTDANAVLKKLDALSLALLTASEDGTKAEKALNKYGESLRNADGSAKSYEQTLQAIANAWQEAEKAGQGYQLLAETGMGKFSTLIASWDGLIERAGKTVSAIGATTKAMHENADKTANLELQTRKLDQALGSNAAAVYTKVLERQAARLAENVKWNNANTRELQAYDEYVGKLTDNLNGFSNTITMVAQKWKKFIGEIVLSTGTDRINVQSALDRELEQKLEDEKKKAQAELVRNQRVLEARAAATAKANAALEKMIWEAKASEYDKEIAKVNDVADLKRKEGADEVKIAEYVAVEKARIDAKYAEKNKDTKAERAAEQARKEYEARVQAAKQASDQIQTVWMTETQRRIAEIEKQKQAWIKAGAAEVEATRAAEKLKAAARISEAERTLKENLKVVRMMAKEEAAGGDWQSRVRARVDKMYMRQNGFKSGDIANLQRYGTDLVNQLANAKDRVFGAFGGSNVTNNNNTTINIDRPVLTDESLINMLADKVAAKLVPVAEKAFGQSANAF